MRLLIVDDEPIIRTGLSKMANQFSPSFSEIITAENGIAALDIIRTQDPEIVMTDIRMPKMDGLELCRIIHEEYNHIQTIVISGHSDFEYAQKCMQYGVKHYVLKPVTTSDVHDVLNDLIKHTQKPYVSISKYMGWIDRMEQCIWSLQQDEMEVLLEEWREYCLSSGMNLSQVVELGKDCINLLIRRFEARSYVPVMAGENQTLFENKIAALIAFEEKLRKLMEDLTMLRNGNFKDPIEEAKAYIESHLSKEITLEEVAGMIGLTPTYFSSLFKKLTKETFVQYRIKKRMEKAQSLLSVPHVKIVDVASEVGYDDYPHFTKTFKKVTGVSPSEYRSSLGIK